MQDFGSVFYRVPPEIWEQVVSTVGKKDLVALALASQCLYPHANALLYRTVELSFAKCSDTYYERLARTLTESPKLAKCATSLLIDMKVVCRVKGQSSLENMRGSTKFNWRRHMQVPFGAAFQPSQHPMGETEWNKHAVQTLRTKRARDILSSLTNLETLTITLGKFDQDEEILSSILSNIPPESMRRIFDLKVHDVSLARTKSLSLFSSLRVLEIGFAKVVSAELWSVLRQNAQSLECMSLSWIMESDQRPVFNDCTGVVLTNLKSFYTKGPHTFSMGALTELLGECSLRELALESLAAPSEQQWSSFLDFLTQNGRNSGQLRTIKFGIATGSTSFWESAAGFISKCSGQLEVISVNGSSRGRTGRFPAVLHESFVQIHQQHDLINCVVMWRDDFGVDESFLITLQSQAHSIRLLHVYVRFPTENEVDRLLELTKAFVQLRALHFVFPTRIIDGEDLYNAAIKKVTSDVEDGCEMFDEWAKKASAQHPDLLEVSWSTYDRMVFSAASPSIYTKIDRSTNALLNLVEEFQAFQYSQSFIHRCSIGAKKVLLSQKPSWREDMGNTLVEKRRVCPYAEFPSTEGSVKRLQYDL